MSRNPSILICDDDKNFHIALKSALKGKYELCSAYNTDEAFVIIKNRQIELIVLDVQMRTHDEGLKAIPRLKEIDPDLSIIISSGITDYRVVREAMRLGAVDFVEKDSETDGISITIAQAIEKRSLIQKSHQQNFEAIAHQKQHTLVGESQAMHALRKSIDRIRQSSANVVITGETGTGKEVVARQLRKSLPDGTLAPFVALDSATIQASTAESILFGHEKGAYTGADRTTKGVFEEADGGIVYFDEIGNMPLEIQAKLLRVIQEREVTRLGSSRIIPLNFRVICATNRDLDEMAKKGEFKDDLLQRLGVLPIQIPPLRERKEDISILIKHFLTRDGLDQRIEFTEDAIETLQAYPWPGNIRELSNLVAYVATMAESNEIDIADLPPKIRDSRFKKDSIKSVAIPGTDGLSFYEQVSAFEKEILQREYSKHEGNISKLALNLGMDRSHLYTKLKEMGIYTGRRKEN